VDHSFYYTKPHLNGLSSIIISLALKKTLTIKYFGGGTLPKDFSVALPPLPTLAAVEALVDVWLRTERCHLTGARINVRVCGSKVRIGVDANNPRGLASPLASWLSQWCDGDPLAEKHNVQTSRRSCGAASTAIRTRATMRMRRSAARRRA
jgi:hypothetical protein